MNTLVALKIGPVSTILAASRRTRDLWFGSFLISEMSKAAARCLDECGWELIYPWSQQWDNPKIRSDKLSPIAIAKDANTGQLTQPPTEIFNVANVIVARGGAHKPADEAIKAARGAAIDCWSRWKKHAYDVAKSLVVKDRWEAQDDYVEVISASVAIDDNFKASFERLMRKIAGQEATRAFQAAPGHSAGIPKSSLDGRHDSVLIPSGERRVDVLKRKPELTLRLRLSPGEEVDALGVMRRAATGEAFPSVVRMAVDPWVRGVAKSDTDIRALQEIDKACCKLGQAAATSGRYFDASAFRHDGSVLFSGRRNAMINNEQDETNKNTLECINKKLAALYGDYGEPQPYYALLIADGDNAGKLREALSTFEEHRAFSGALTAFASTARQKLNLLGACTIFAAGEDVLALLPLDQAMDAARQVQACYTDHLKIIKSTASVSAGVVIAHCNEDLAEVLAFARTALQTAKAIEGKNALAVHLYTRGGAPIRLSEPWPRGLPERLTVWAQAYVMDAVTRSLGYSMHQLVPIYAGWDPNNYRAARELIKAEIGRMLQRKKVNQGACDQLLDAINCALALNAQDRADPAPLLRAFADELIVAARLATAIKQAATKATTEADLKEAVA